jgi:hypothetical protein
VSTVSIAVASLGGKYTEMGSSKMYARWLSRFVQVLLSCGIVNAQSLVPVEIGRVPYGIWIVSGNCTAQTLAEDSYTFQAAMVLLASGLVGPYVDRIAKFVGYPCGLVQVIGARLQEAKIWERDEVRCEEWFDPKKGAIAFVLDLSVAEGRLMRTWSEEKNQYAYHETDIRAVSKFAV